MFASHAIRSTALLQTASHYGTAAASADGIAISSNSIYTDGMYGVYIEQNSSTLKNISLASNCFANLGWGTVSDNRSGGLLPVPSSPSCSPANGSDATAPSASIVSPANGATISATLSITVNATDNVGVAGVQLQLDGAPLGAEMTKSPYTFLWDPKSTSNGSHSLVAVARDAAGNRSTSPTIGIVVSNPDVTAPQVAITSPANGSTVSGSVQVTATATDNIGVAGVQFKVDGAALNGELSSGPYATTWNTGSMKNGSHQVSAVVRDAAGNQSTSTISINVANSDSTAPQAAITAPANGATVSGMVAVSATATDNIGVAGVQFYVDGAALGQESTSAPYSISWNAAAAAPGTHQLSAVARDAAGNRATCEP